MDSRGDDLAMATEKLTPEQQQWVAANLRIAVVAAGHACQTWESTSYDEALASSYYGLCLAPLGPGFSMNPEGYAGLSCRHWIWNDRYRGLKNHVGAKKIDYFADLVDVAGHDWSPLDAIVDTEETEQLYRAVAELRPKQRQVIEAKLAGQRMDELATELGVCNDAIMQRQRSALSRLREAMKQA